jgi:hypothetical protein
LLLIRQDGIAPQPVYAQSGCSQYPHCYSVLLGSDIQLISGIWMQTQNVSIHAGNSIHTNNTIWMHVSDGTNDLIEMGQNGILFAGTNYYEYYAAVNGAIVWFAYTSADDSTHKFYMMSNGTTTWTFYFDGQGEYSQNFGIKYGSASYVETGGEIYLSSPNNLDSTIYTSTFSNYVQELDYSGGNYHPWGSYSWHIDQPCSVGVTNCMNGQIPSTSVWNWNKIQ